MKFIENLKSGKMFLWQLSYKLIRVIGVADDNNPEIYHIYFEDNAKKDAYGNKLEHGGILIEDAVWDADYTISSNAKSIGVGIGDLEAATAKLNSEVSAKATEIVYDEVLKLANSAIKFAKTELNRMKTETGYQPESGHFDIRQCSSKASKSILEDLNYESRDGYYAKGMAYTMFYHGKPDEQTPIIQTEITKQDVLKYLAADAQGKTAVFDGFVDETVEKARQEMRSPASKIVDKLAHFIIAEEYYDELVADVHGEHYLIRKIYDSVNCDEAAGAKTVKITAEIEGKTFEFSYEKNCIRHENNISEYHISPAIVRSEIKMKLKERYERLGYWHDKIFLSDILEISYKKKILYKKEGK